MKHLIFITLFTTLIFSCKKKEQPVSNECTSTTQDNDPPCDLVYEIGYGEEFWIEDSLTPGANYRYHFIGENNTNNEVWSIAFMSQPTDEGDYLIVDTLTAENHVVVHLRYPNHYFYSVETGEKLYLRRNTENSTIMNFTICNIHIRRVYEPAILSGFTLAKKLEMP